MTAHTGATVEKGVCVFDAVSVPEGVPVLDTVGGGV